MSGIIPLNPASYQLKPIESDIQLKHPSPYFAQEDVVNKMNQFGLNYSAQFQNDILIVTDGSLLYGGLYDVAGKWTPPHHEHRTGRDIDIRTQLAGRIGGIPLRSIRDEEGNTIRKNERFESIALTIGAIRASVHFPTTNDEHYHVDF